MTVVVARDGLGIHGWFGTVSLVQVIILLIKGRDHATQYDLIALQGKTRYDTFTIMHSL